MTNRKVERVTAELRESIVRLNRLLASVEHPGGKIPVLEELYRRTNLQSVPDGYPARTLPETSVSGGGGHSSVEGSAFLRNPSWTPGAREHHDAIKAEGEEAKRLLTLIPKLVDELDRKVGFVISAGKFRCEKHLCECDSNWGDRDRLSCSRCGCKAKPPRGSGMSECQACKRPVACTAADPLRGGLCSACRMAWERAGRPLPGPERTRFEEERRRRREERSA